MFVVPRVFKDATPEDTAAIQPVIDQVLMYPLSQFDGTMKKKDYGKSPHFPVPSAGGHAPKGESRWVNPATYYEELAVVMKEVPPPARRGSTIPVDFVRMGSRRQEPRHQEGAH
ncbi:hypothetical protein AB4Z51_42325 [Bradyrhizobium sp. 2TAF36]|uniref:hypothetical protein n=1 Tax=Bradyrhizobium sp. 2TAF36 TaxID=3233016 RepID=UPI003F927736